MKRPTIAALLCLALAGTSAAAEQGALSSPPQPLEQPNPAPEELAGEPEVLPPLPEK